MEIYSIGIFDPYAPTPEERTGPQLLDDISSSTGGRLFRVDDVDEMSDIAEKISTELRNQYVIGYKPKDLTRDGKWRKVKVKVNPPPGLASAHGLCSHRVLCASAITRFSPHFWPRPGLLLSAQQSCLRRKPGRRRSPRRRSR